jgi:GTP-binding protein Era
MKSAFVTLFGRPSSGKSTLINKICKQKISIVSSTPQTTRNIIRGIYSIEKGQIIFQDTPGYHISEKKINNQLKQVTEKAINNAEIILYVIDSSREIGEEEKNIIEYISLINSPVVIALNKIDILNFADKNKKEFFTGIENFLKKKLKEKYKDRQISICQVSAKTGEKLDTLINMIFEYAEEGELFYPEDIYTDQDVTFRISEIIREKAINRTKEEIPHSLYVEIADIQTIRTDGKESLWVRAFLIVESESQKGIVIGSGGEKIKAIRIAAKKEIKSIFPYPVQIDLRVKVNKNWRRKNSLLNNLIK